jgi:hypothetical protein
MDSTMFAPRALAAVAGGAALVALGALGIGTDFAAGTGSLKADSGHENPGPAYVTPTAVVSTSTTTQALGPGH